MIKFHHYLELCSTSHFNKGFLAIFFLLLVYLSDEFKECKACLTNILINLLIACDYLHNLLSLIVLTSIYQTPLAKRPKCRVDLLVFHLFNFFVYYSEFRFWYAFEIYTIKNDKKNMIHCEFFRNFYRGRHC